MDREAVGIDQEPMHGDSDSPEPEPVIDLCDPPGLEFEVLVKQFA